MQQSRRQEQIREATGWRERGARVLGPVLSACVASNRYDAQPHGPTEVIVEKILEIIREDDAAAEIRAVILEHTTEDEIRELVNQKLRGFVVDVSNDVTTSCSGVLALTFPKRRRTMARPPNGSIVERDGKRGRVYALRFRAYG